MDILFIMNLAIPNLSCTPMQNLDIHSQRFDFDRLVSTIGGSNLFYSSADCVQVMVCIPTDISIWKLTTWVLDCDLFLVSSVFTINLFYTRPSYYQKHKNHQQKCMIAKNSPMDHQGMFKYSFHLEHQIDKKSEIFNMVIKPDSSLKISTSNSMLHSYREYITLA